MRFAVTGATGFVGHALAARLRRFDHEVVAYVRDPGRADRLSASGVTLVAGDLDDRAGLDRLCTGIDGLFHVAGWYHVGTGAAEQAWRTNVEGSRNVLDAAYRAEVPRVVYTSTLAVNSDTRGAVRDEGYRFEGEHLSVYDETKARAHDLATEAAADGLPVVIVMPGAVYGPGDTSQTGHLVDAVIRGGRPVVPSGGELCWAHVDDVASGHALAMERGVVGESYMLAGERSSLADALRLVAGLAGTPGPIVVPAAAVRTLAALAGTVERLVRLPPGYAAETLRASLATYLGTPEKARAELGWSARSLRAGMQQLVADAGRDDDG